MKRFGYARVSRKEQNLDLQLAALKKAECDKIFTEKESGRNRNRQVLKRLFNTVEKGDSIVVYKIDRLARSARHICEITEKMKDKGVIIISLSEGINTSSPIAELFCKLAGIFAEMEVNYLRERTVEGLAAAKTRGVKLGRPSKPKHPKDKINLIQSLLEKGNSVNIISKETQIPSSTIYRYLKLKYINQNKRS